MWQKEYADYKNNEKTDDKKAHPEKKAFNKQDRRKLDFVDRMTENNGFFRDDKPKGMGK